MSGELHLEFSCVVFCDDCIHPINRLQRIGLMHFIVRKMKKLTRRTKRGRVGVGGMISAHTLAHNSENIYYII